MKTTLAVAATIAAVQAHGHEGQGRHHENHGDHEGWKEGGDGHDGWGEHHKEHGDGENFRGDAWDNNQHHESSNSQVGHHWKHHDSSSSGDKWFDGSDLSEHLKEWFSGSGSGSGHHRWGYNWRHHRNGDGDDHDDDDHHKRDGEDRRHDGFDHNDHDDNDDFDGQDNQDPLTISFPLLFSQPVEAVGASIQKLNEITATVAAKFDFLQEIRIMFACPAKSCLYGCPETEELRMQAGCIEPRKAGALQAGAGESIVAVEVVVASLPTPADIKLLLEMLQNANLMPLMESGDVMNAIGEEEHYRSEHHRHHHHHHGRSKVVLIISIVGAVIVMTLSVVLCCTCCKKRRTKKSMAVKATELEKVVTPMQAIPVSEEEIQKEGFAFDPVVKPTEEVVVGEVAEPVLE